MVLLDTAIYAGLSGAMLVGLSVNVVRRRRGIRQAMGDGNDFELMRRVRAHANFVEYTPLFLFLLLIAEGQGMHKAMVHVYGLLFLAGRGLHAYSLLKAEEYQDGKITAFPRFRLAGMISTFTVIVLLSLTVMWQYLSLVVF